jgi:hypothetical protein
MQPETLRFSIQLSRQLRIWLATVESVVVIRSISEKKKGNGHAVNASHHRIHFRSDAFGACR